MLTGGDDLPHRPLSDHLESEVLSCMTEMKLHGRANESQSHSFIINIHMYIRILHDRIRLNVSVPPVTCGFHSGGKASSSHTSH